MHVLRIAGLALLAAAGCSRAPAPPSEAPPADHAAHVQAWRDKHEEDYRRDFVTVSGLHFLDTGSHTIGSGPKNTIVIDSAIPEQAGTLRVDGGRVVFEPARGVAVRRKGEPVDGTVVLKEPGGSPLPEISIGDVRLVIHVTGERLALRVRDPSSAQAKAFLGFAWFAIDPAYRVVAQFVRDAAPQNLKVVNTLDGIDTYSTDGVLEFELHGTRLRLRPFTTRPKRFYLVFRDASSGVETYSTARFLYADLRDDGTAVLDFNEAYNPPCAFNKYTTCPLPLKENVLPVKILAGEKAYGGTNH